MRWCVQCAVWGDGRSTEVGVIFAAATYALSSDTVVDDGDGITAGRRSEKVAQCEAMMAVMAGSNILATNRVQRDRGNPQSHPVSSTAICDLDR